MTEWLQYFYFGGWIVMFIAIGAGFWRLVVGPTTLDRLLGFDLVTITVVALVVIFSAHTRTIDYLELVLVLAALGFLTTVAYFYYLMQLTPQDKNFDEEEKP